MTALPLPEAPPLWALAVREGGRSDGATQASGPDGETRAPLWREALPRPEARQHAKGPEAAASKARAGAAC